MAERPNTKPSLMTHGGYLRHYLSDPRVQIYLALALSATVVTFAAFPSHPGVLWGVLAAVCFEPFAEYIIHRYVFHNKLLYRFPGTAGFWKHMHYDHHRDPNDEETIFGPADWMLAASLIITFPVGYLAGGWAGAAGAAMVGFWILVVYEYFHGAAHLLTDPPTAYGRWVKRIHVLHHFHNEKGNFGITNPIVDLLVGTYYPTPKDIERSPTARNLGYTAEEAQKFPWVEELDKAQGRKDPAEAPQRAPDAEAN